MDKNLMQPSPYKKSGKRMCNPTGWYMSEKLDGMKGRWLDGKFVTRSGQHIDAPKWFLELLPDFDIEGELYFGRNSFHRTGSLRSSSNPKSWEKVCFHVFDAVDYRLTWLERQAKLENIRQNERIQVVAWIKIRSVEHLEQEYKNITEQLGEGVVIADPWGQYENGHVGQILKYKAVQDCEAVIIGYNTDDSGDRLASFSVNPINEHTGKVNKKITFSIGTGLKAPQRYNFKKRYPIGTIVSYTYELMGKNGKPRTPIFKGIRVDWPKIE
jgi:DNA ligase-1